MESNQVRGLISMHSLLNKAYNRNATSIALNEGMHDHDQQVVDTLLREYHLEKQWLVKSGAVFEVALQY